VGERRSQEDKMTEQRDDFDTKGNADNDGGTSGDYIGGQSGMNSELGAGVSRDMGKEMGSKMSRDEGKDLGAGRDSTGKRYMGGEDQKSSDEEKPSQ
jgi:hypothetical protein